MVDEFSTDLVSKIPTPIGNALMNMLNRHTSFRPFECPFRRFREFALRFRQFAFIPAKETGICDFGSVGQSRKTFKPYIHSNSQFVVGQPFGVHFTSKTSIPFANSISFDRESFNFAFQGTMQNDFHSPDFGKKQTILQELKAELFEGETIVPTLTPKAWIAWLLTRLHSSKEPFESQIHSFLNVLQHLREYALQFRISLSPEGEPLIGFIQRERLLLLLPGYLSSGKCFIKDPTTNLQRLNKFCSLALRGLQTIFEGFHLVFYWFSMDCVKTVMGAQLTGETKSKCVHNIGKTPFQLWKLLAKPSRKNAFHLLHELRQSELWVNFAKEVNRVWPPFYFQEGTFQLFGGLIDDFFQALILIAGQYSATILWTKNSRIFAGVEDNTIAFIDHKFYYTTMPFLMSRLAHIIPTATPSLTADVVKRGVFRRCLVK